MKVLIYWILSTIQELSKSIKIRVIDNLITADASAALSANMGKELKQMIVNSWDGSKYLSLWNAETGLPVKDPPFAPYEYETGMFYIVDFVAEDMYKFYEEMLIKNTKKLEEMQNLKFSKKQISRIEKLIEEAKEGMKKWENGVNYRPTGTEYVPGVASTEVETNPVAIGDKYRFNGTEWELQHITAGDVTFASLLGDPEDNQALNTSLNGKLDKDISTSTYDKAYIKKSDGTQDSKPATRDAYANSIVVRDANNRFAVGTPAATTDVVNKQYADNMLNMGSAGVQGATLRQKWTDVSGNELIVDAVVVVN